MIGVEMVGNDEEKLCVVHETSVVTSTPLPPIQIPSLAQDYSSALSTIATLVIEPQTVVVEDISKDSHLLLDDRFNTPIIPPSLEITFQDSHAFTFEHQLGLPTSPYIQGFYHPCPLPLFSSDWSHTSMFIDMRVLPFWGLYGVSYLYHGWFHCTYGFERIS